MKVKILGCHSATPRTNAHPTSQLLEVKNHYFLIDCGEGTQVQLRKFKVKFSKINHIFISHLHGDHYFGLIGLISSFALLGRTKELHIHGPKGIKEIILLQLKYAKSYPKYHIEFNELESKESQLIYEDDKVTVTTIPLKHRVYTNGYLFKEKIGERKLNTAAISQEDRIDICDYHNLKKGKDIILENSVILENKTFTLDPPAPKSYAFCSDTIYKPDIVPIIENVSLLYHESTFLKDREDLATSTFHSTAEQAAKIAKKANANQLLLGHYSSRYENKEDFLVEAKETFENTALAFEGLDFTID